MNNHIPTPEQVESFRGILRLGLGTLVTDYVKAHPNEARWLHVALAIISVDEAFFRAEPAGAAAVTAAGTAATHADFTAAAGAGMTAALIDQVEMTQWQHLAALADRATDQMAKSPKRPPWHAAFFGTHDEAEVEDDPSALARQRLDAFFKTVDDALTFGPCDAYFLGDDTLIDLFEDDYRFGPGCDYGDGFDAGRFVIMRVMAALTCYEPEAFAGFLGQGQSPAVQAQLVAAVRAWRRRES